MMGKTSLRKRLQSVRRRLLMIGSTAALTWGLALVLVLLLAGAWLDLLWELSPEGRIATLLAAGGVGTAWICVLVGITAYAGRDVPVARRLDRAAHSGGDILTGLELADGPRGQQASTLTAGLARMAVDHAATVAGRAPVAKAAPAAKPLGRSLGTLVFLLAAVWLLSVCLPGLARTQWNRFTNPFGDLPPFSRIEFEVTPGDVEVLYGSELDIYATTSGAPVDEVELVLVEEDTGEQETLPMFPEPSGRWRAALAKVTAPAVYYVRSYRARSEKYQIRVITVPRIESVRVRITPPPYTNRNHYEGPMPKEGVAGLPGTKVRIWATSNRPLSGGTITLTGQSDPAACKILVGMTAGAQLLPHCRLPLAAPWAETLNPNRSMQPVAAAANEVSGGFAIHGDGKFEFRVQDVDHVSSQQSFAGSITLLADERPFIRLLQPKKTSLATPNVVLPVELLAEDDYGISRVQLYRSLNDSRPLPTDVPVAQRPPRRVHQQIYLPLEEYGLEPGDVIKLFGRVEDNDPAGVKGSESSVVTVQIISQEEYERMLRVREGLEVLMSKYAAARRRMEGLAREIEGLRKKLKELPPQSPVTPEIRKQAKRLLQRLRKESEAIRKLAGHKLPYDLDEKLTPQLETLARIPEEVAEELEKLLEQADLHHQQLARQLEKLSQRLASGRRQFGQTALAALEHLATVFPLIADQSRFVMLVLRQRDLAERLSALKGRDGEDNPALKTRMRDLEQEQRQIREDLSTLLDDVEDHVQRLPEDPQFDKLRETAAKFAKDLRASGASQAMAEAEAALAEFSGTRGYQKAQEAADILGKFLKECEGMGNCAGDCLIFQPTLGNCLGNTVGQLLAEMGMGFGTGFGSGFGMGSGMGGYSVRRGGTGLYGSMPGWGEAYGESFGGQGPRDDPPGDFARGGANPDEPTLIDSPAEVNASMIGEGAVPVRYRRRVGQYFQRVAEEVEHR